MKSFDGPLEQSELGLHILLIHFSCYQYMNFLEPEKNSTHMRKSKQKH